MDLPGWTFGRSRNAPRGYRNPPAAYRSFHKPETYPRSRTYCVTCGNPGHHYKSCRGPVTSFGLIAFRYHTKGLKAGDLGCVAAHLGTPYYCDVHAGVPKFDPGEYNEHEDGNLSYILIQRKDTIGYIDLVRGKYPEGGELEEAVKQRVSETCCEERLRLRHWTFAQIWGELWHNKTSRLYNEERPRAGAKYARLDLARVLDAVPCQWYQTEFGFPKGRKNAEEGHLECAKREFCEETGFRESDFAVLPIEPFEELFTGSDGIRYRHVYFLVEMHESKEFPKLDFSNTLQAGEVRNAGWFTFSQGRRLIRSYDQAKLNVLNQVHLYLRRRYDPVPL